MSDKPGDPADKITDVAFPCAIQTAMALLAAFTLSVIFDAAQSFRAEPAAYACEAKGMSYRRVTFTVTVVCITETR